MLTGAAGDAGAGDAGALQVIVFYMHDPPFSLFLAVNRDFQTLCPNPYIIPLTETLSPLLEFHYLKNMNRSNSLF